MLPKDGTIGNDCLKIFSQSQPLLHKLAQHLSKSTRLRRSYRLKACLIAPHHEHSRPMWTHQIVAGLHFLQSTLGSLKLKAQTPT